MKTPKIEFKNVNIKAVKPYDNNPRENSGAVGYVAQSIAEFGFKRPLVVDEKMVLLAGHTRLLALQQLGVETVLVAVVKGLTEEEKIAYRIKDNRAGELTLFDFEKVEKEILTFRGIDMTLFGFEPIKVEPPDAVDFSVKDIGEEKSEGGEPVICPRCGKVVG